MPPADGPFQGRREPGALAAFGASTAPTPHAPAIAFEIGTDPRLGAMTRILKSPPARRWTPKALGWRGPRRADAPSTVGWLAAGRFRGGGAERHRRRRAPGLADTGRVLGPAAGAPLITPPHLTRSRGSTPAVGARAGRPAARRSRPAVRLGLIRRDDGASRSFRQSTSRMIAATVGASAPCRRDHERERFAIGPPAPRLWAGGPPGIQRGGFHSKHGEDNLTHYLVVGGSGRVRPHQHFVALANSARQFLPWAPQLGNNCRAKQA